MKKNSTLVLEQASHLIAARRYQQALDLLTEHGADFIGQAIFFHLLGDCYLGLKKYRLANSHYQEALKVDPQDVWLLLSVVRLKIITHDLFGAEMLLRNCLAINPNLPEIFFLRGELYLANRAPGKSIEQFDRALQLDPENAAALASKSFALSLRLQHSEAERVSRAALRLDPENANALSVRALNELLQGQADEAASLFRNALRLDPLDELALAGYKQALRLQSRFWRPLLDLELAYLKRPGLQRLFVWAGYLLAFSIGAYLYLTAPESPTQEPLLTGLTIYLACITFLPKAVPLLALMPLLLHRSADQLMSKKEIIVASVAISILLVGVITLLAAFFFPEIRLLNGLLLYLAGIFAAELKEKAITGTPFFILLLLNVAYLSLSVLFLDASYRTSGLMVLLLLLSLIYLYLAKLFSIRERML